MDVLSFPKGLLGFDQLKSFVLIKNPKTPFIEWLQSVEKSEIAFAVTKPEIFDPGYKVNLSKQELEDLKLENSEQCQTYVILTIPPDITQMSANMKAPIGVNVQAKIARQVILQNSKLQVKEMIYEKLRSHLLDTK